jgi:hypothetical protein
VETPEANLVAGMRWLLSSYTLRLNHRHSLAGHVFSGRYKALIVDGSGGGYLRTACDYVHLNPARANLLSSEELLLAYPWSSLVWYMAAPEHRPTWMRVDRLLGEHGINADTPAGRQEFARRMEARRAQRAAEAEWAPMRRGWCLGSEAFRQQLLERMEGRLGQYHSGTLRRESAEAKAERITADELLRLGWTSADLERRRKNDLGKMEIAVRLRRETTMTIGWIARRLHLGTQRSAATRLQEAKRSERARL